MTLIGDDEVEIDATLNGKPLKRRVKARLHLADFLRQELELTGTHLGCEHGICGACTVLLDGRTARSCLTLAAQISGKSVVTIEGLDESGELADSAEGVHRAQRRTVRLLLVGHAADRLRAPVVGRETVACRDKRSHIWQHVPLHRLPRHRRRDRSGRRQRAEGNVACPLSPRPPPASAPASHAAS